MIMNHCWRGILFHCFHLCLASSWSHWRLAYLSISLWLLCILFPRSSLELISSYFLFLVFSLFFLYVFLCSLRLSLLWSRTRKDEVSREKRKEGETTGSKENTRKRKYVEISSKEERWKKIQINQSDIGRDASLHWHRCCIGNLEHLNDSFSISFIIQLFTCLQSAVSSSKQIKAIWVIARTRKTG